MMQHVVLFFLSVDLTKDWSATEPLDIAKFLPYEWEFHLYIRDFELILLANEFNWVDCTNENENSKFFCYFICKLFN